MTDSPPNGAVTIRQLAAHLDLATSTVSRAFNRPEMLPPTTVERVKAAAEELGYRPNRAARALSTGRSGNLALVVPDIANPFFPPIIRAAQLRADSQGMYCFLGDSNETAGREEELITRMAPQVEGMVVVSSRLPDLRVRKLAELTRIVLINRDIAGLPRILIDTSPGIREAMEHLQSLGHERFVYVGGPRNSWSDSQRRQAARAFARKHGLALTAFRCDPATYDGGRDIVEDLLRTEMTAVLAFDDVIARGVIGGLAERGVSVPTDVSVVGCDDVFGSVSHPPLTSIVARCSEAGDLAMSVLLTAREGELPDERHVLKCSLIRRSTTGPVAKSSRRA